MFPCKKILCPTDFSESAGKAIRAAFTLAEKVGAELTLVHVADALPMNRHLSGRVCKNAEKDIVTNVPFDVSEYMEKRKADALRKLWKEVGNFEKGSVKSSILVVEGNAVSEILNVATEMNADLILMAESGESKGRHPFLRTVTQGVAQCAPISVMIFR